MELLNTTILNLQHAILRFSSSSSSFFEHLHFFLTRLCKFPRRSELPTTLIEWKNIGSEEDDETKIYSKIWAGLEVYFHEHQFTLFRRRDEYNQSNPDLPAPSNYIYYPVNGFTHTGSLRVFPVRTACHHAARKNNRHYVIRVISVDNQGLNHLKILRLLSNTVPDNLYSNYHILPMLEEMMYEDIYFAAFPLVFGQLQEILNPNLSKCTLEEALHLIMQALEGIIYVHGKNIAHRDLYTDNFLVDFIPNSLVAQHWARPRVYLSDFETAIHFSDDTKLSKRLVSGFPFEHFGIETYNRKPPAPELLMPESHMYCPFKLDMFQFGSHLVQYLKTTGFEELDCLWPPLMSENPADRPTATALFKSLGNFINSTPPKELQQTWTYQSVPVWI